VYVDSRSNPWRLVRLTCVCTRQTLSIHIWQVAEMGVARSQRTPQRMTMHVAQPLLAVLWRLADPQGRDLA